MDEFKIETEKEMIFELKINSEKLKEDKESYERLKQYLHQKKKKNWNKKYFSQK